MLYYAEAGLSHLDIPNETALCIYRSGCWNNCKHCHYPQLYFPGWGDRLSDHYEKLVQLYLKRAACVCFLREGANTAEEHEEFRLFTEYAHANGLKTCLYSGRDTCSEPWA